jgi:hypothetical protein
MISDDTEHACMTAQALLTAPEDEARFARSLDCLERDSDETGALAGHVLDYPNQAVRPHRPVRAPPRQGGGYPGRSWTRGRCPR